MNEEEITEETVEGIYVESQFKIENVPGYAEAFKRVSAILRKSIQGTKLNKRDEKELGHAMGELMMLDMEYQFSKIGKGAPK
jgi:hypothetical protein